MVHLLVLFLLYALLVGVFYAQPFSEALARQGEGDDDELEPYEPEEYPELPDPGVARGLQAGRA